MSQLQWKVRLVAAASVLLLGTCGCHSSYVEATVRNTSAEPVTLMEVDYPSASFGTSTLASGAAFKYRFKILGSGATKITWTDAARQEHSVAGPELHEGEEGQLVVTLGISGADWKSQLHRR